MAVRSPFPDVQIPEISICDLILSKAEQHGDRLAYVDDDTGHKITYKEFAAAIRVAARGFHARGIQLDDVVCLYLTNCIEYSVLFYGALLAGGIISGANHALTDAELLRVVQLSKPRFVFTTPELINKYKRSTASLDISPSLFTVKGSVDGYLSYNDFMSEGGMHTDVAVSIKPRDKEAVYTFSTGTSGLKKCVVITHYAYVANIYQFSKFEKPVFGDGGVLLSIRPYTHGYGLIVDNMAGSWFGYTAILSNKGTHPKTLLSLVEKYKATFVALTPLNLIELMRQSNREDFDVSSLRCVMCAGAPLNASTQKEFQNCFKGVTVWNLFGMSECGLATMQRYSADDGVGVLLPNVQAKIVRVDSGEVLGVKEQGELWIHSPALFKEYRDQPDVTLEALRKDGWLCTGDEAYFDEHGNFFIVDRIKELLSYDALKVSPSEIEGVILQLNEVAEVAVVGFPDPVYTHAPRAYVVKQPGSTVTETDIIKFVEKECARKMWLSGGVRFVDSLPKAASGKILRRLVKEQMLREMKD